MTPSTTTLSAVFSRAKAGPPESPKQAVPPGRDGSVEAAPQKSHDGSKRSDTSWQEAGSAASINAARSAEGACGHSSRSAVAR